MGQKVTGVGTDTSQAFPRPKLGKSKLTTKGMGGKGKGKRLARMKAKEQKASIFATTKRK